QIQQLFSQAPIDFKSKAALTICFLPFSDNPLSMDVLATGFCVRLLIGGDVRNGVSVRESDVRRTRRLIGGTISENLVDENGAEMEEDEEQLWAGIFEKINIFFGCRARVGPNPILTSQLLKL
ncbi:hapless 8, partial [Striga asiatica]